MASEPSVPLVALGSSASDDEFRARAQIFVREPFDLARGPLARLAYASFGPDEHALVLAIHHAISEVQSLGVLIGDLARAYRGERLEPLPIQFSDFAAWQRQRAAGPEGAAELAWWRERLRGLAPLELPADHPRPAVQGFAGGTASRALPAELARAVRELARAENATVFAVALAAFATVLGRRARSLDVAIGAPMTDRDRPELEPLIGFFVSTLVLRCDLGGEPSMRQLVARCQAAALDAREHRDLPFERLVEALAPERDLSRSPLFQVAALLQNESEQGAAHLELGAGAWLAPEGDALALHTETSKFDLSLIVQSRRDGGLGLAFEYATALYERATIERLLGHLETFLAGALAEPDRPVSSIGLLAHDERRVLLEQWNATAAPLPERTVHELFAEAAAAAPAGPGRRRGPAQPDLRRARRALRGPGGAPAPERRGARRAGRHRHRAPPRAGGGHPGHAQGRGGLRAARPDLSRRATGLHAGRRARQGRLDATRARRRASRPIRATRWPSTSTSSPKARPGCARAGPRAKRERATWPT